MSTGRTDRPPPSPLAEPLPLDAFERFVRLNAARELSAEASARGRAREELLRRVTVSARAGARAAAQAFPGAVAATMGELGWAWNGFYVARARADGTHELALGHAHGPPVCSPLEPSGGILSSGMCFDAWWTNQTLVAYDVRAWPGYVSCDAASGLATVAGLVCPVRDARGVPIGVWDLDATRALEPGDVRFFDVLLASLARCVAFTASDLAR